MQTVILPALAQPPLLWIATLTWWGGLSFQ